VLSIPTIVGSLSAYSGPLTAFAGSLCCIVRQSRLVSPLIGGEKLGPRARCDRCPRDDELETQTANMVCAQPGPMRPWMRLISTTAPGDCSEALEHHLFPAPASGQLDHVAEEYLAVRRQSAPSCGRLVLTAERTMAPARTTTRELNNLARN